MFKFCLLISICIICLVVSSGRYIQQPKCGYRSCTKPKEGFLNVHMLAHTHDDVGWLKTVDQYYYGSKASTQEAGVQYIIDSLVSSLLRDSKRKFIYVETAFFWKWWLRQNEKTHKQVKKLVNEGRLEFIGGGWSMHDEAATHYHSIVDQMTWGFRKLDDTFGECGRPRIGWQIDPFGHSRESASLMARFGFDGLLFGRLDYQEKQQRFVNQTAEMIWEASPNLGQTADLFTSVLYDLYVAPSKYCFDILCDDDPIIDDRDSPEFNADQKEQKECETSRDLLDSYLCEFMWRPRNNDEDLFDTIWTDINLYWAPDKKASSFIAVVNKMFKNYKSSNLLVTMGMDFNFQAANKNFINIDRLIEAVNALQANGSNVNLFYSTPSCYLKALNDENLTWPTKDDDFFPYASAPHAYWTGYFSSRPAIKCFERMGNNFLQVCKQLYTLGEIDDSERTKLNLMREGMGILQHHDAITGTEKQAVAFDYARQLSIGFTNCGSIVDAALRKLMSKDKSTKVTTAKSPSDILLKPCMLLNISSCDVTETSNTFVVTLYNPLSRQVSQNVRLPVSGDGKNVVVYDSLGVKLTVQIIPIPETIQMIPGRSSSATVEVVFVAANLPALGYKSYYVTNNEAASNLEDIPVDATAATFRLKDDKIRQSFWWYKSFPGTNVDEEHRASGAYVFRPYGDPTNVNQSPKTVNYTGPVVDEIHQVFNDWVSQVIRKYKGSNTTEYHWLIGPIPINDKNGKEIVTRYNITSIASNKIFYTDSNGREMLQRTRDTRPSYKVDLKEPVAGNYYPVNTRIMIKDNKTQMSVITDRSHGGASINDGQVELMLHRRILCDDGFGVAEALNETAFGIGLVVRGTHYVISGDPASQSATDRLLVQEQILSAWTFFTSTTMTLDEWKKIYNMEYSGLKKALPSNVQITTLEPWKDNSYLIRLEHIMEKNDDSDWSKPVAVNLKNIFSPFEVTSIKETTLGANQLFKNMKRLVWKKESKNEETFKGTWKEEDNLSNRGTPKITLEEEKHEEDNLTKKGYPRIKLSPMEIRSFIVKINFK